MKCPREFDLSAQLEQIRVGKLTATFAQRRQLKRELRYHKLEREFRQRLSHARDSSLPMSLIADLAILASKVGGPNRLGEFCSGYLALLRGFTSEGEAAGLSAVADRVLGYAIELRLPVYVARSLEQTRRYAVRRERLYEEQVAQEQIFKARERFVEKFDVMTHDQRQSFERSIRLRERHTRALSRRRPLTALPRRRCCASRSPAHRSAPRRTARRAQHDSGGSDGDGDGDGPGSHEHIARAVRSRRSLSEWLCRGRCAPLHPGGQHA